MKNLKDVLIDYCYQDIKTEMDLGGIPTRDDIPNILGNVIERFKQRPLQNFNIQEIENIQKKEIIDFLLTKIDTGIGKNLKLIDDKTDHLDWLPNADKSDWYYSERFLKHLSQKKSYGPMSAKEISDSADEILALLENPKRQGHWRRQGLVFGNVQSGKTSSYSALINKAVDAGYKYIIVLGGLNKNLRSQTQIALEENFSGLKTPTRKDSSTGPVGVGNIPVDSDKNLDVTVFTSRADNGDFKKSDVTRSQSMSINEEQPRLFVVKKNVSPLKYLLQYLFTKIKDEDGINEPLLLIDDECDNGSVNTKDRDKDPTRFNAYIRAILSLFNRSAYVAYTATPFANIFINPAKSKFKIYFDGDVVKDEDGNALWESKGGKTVKKIEKIEKEIEDSDLFPRDFVIILKDNNAYVGAKKLFNIPDDLDEKKDVEALPVVKTTEQLLNYDPQLEKLERDWIPLKHKQTHTFEYDGDEREMSPTLEYAIKCFILSIAARNERFNDETDHNTMLVNVTNWNRTQQQIFELVENKLLEITDGIKGNFLDCIEDLKNIWEKDFQNTTKELNDLILNNLISVNHQNTFQEISWSQIEKRLKSEKITKEISVQKVYGNNKDVLLYEDYRDTGLNLIAVGAIKLSRGLVLENLTVSYFKRPAKQYDTLLQMGRWFGYRPNYLDLCRLIIDDNLLTRFERSAWASETLKKDFKEMIKHKGNPSNWGHRVRTYSDVEDLIPTSKNKMLSATSYNLSFDGKRKETTRWSIENDDISNNINFFKDLIRNIENYQNLGNKDDKLHIWRNNKSEKILSFLNKYNYPAGIEKNAKLNEIIEYINQCNVQGKLKNWDIFVKGKKNSKEFQVDDFNFSLLKREPFSGRSANVLKKEKHFIVQNRKKIFFKEGFENPSNELKNFFYLGGVGDKDLSSVVDDQKILIEALNETKKNDPNAKEPSEDDIRSKLPPNKGYLGFYLFDPRDSDHEVLREFYKDLKSPLIGFTISFPGTLGVTYQYVINKQKQKELEIFEEDEDENEDEAA